MPKNVEDVKLMQEKDAKIKELEEKCKKLVGKPTSLPLFRAQERVVLFFSLTFWFRSMKK